MAKTKLTPELHTAIINYIAEGNTLKDTAGAVGLHRRTITDWEQRGLEEMETLHPNPDDYTRPQLVALAATQGIEHKPRATKKTLAALVYTETPFTHFARDITRAKHEAVTYAIRAMRKAGRDDWRFWQYFLSVHQPDRWAKSAIDDAVLAGTARADEVDKTAALDRGEKLVKLTAIAGGKQ